MAVMALKCCHLSCCLWLQGESPSSCGWSFVLVAGDVLQSPGQFLQLQVAQLSCSNESAELRSQLTFFELTDDQLPCLISQPEPAWLTADIKQRSVCCHQSAREVSVVCWVTGVAGGVILSMLHIYD
jgi:hypothetical protein